MVDEVIVVGPDGVPGGDTWMASVQVGLEEINASPNDLVLVHNAANPYVSEQEITDVLTAAKQHGAAAVSHPAVDTLMLEQDGFYDGHIDRRLVRHMQTPQAARYEFLEDLPESTDLISALPIPAKVVEAGPYNRKITAAADLPVKVAIGQDSHRFSDAGTLTLGGLAVADAPAMQANSDGDVILHAIGRALAQTQGKTFSEIADGMQEAGTQDSAHYLKPFLGTTIHNVSIMLEGSRPKIDPIKLQLKENIATILGIQAHQISIAAMTGEELTPFGKGEGLQCTCVLTYS